MTADQFRAARAMLDLSTRDVAKVIGFSAMMISKVERDVPKTDARCWKALLEFYWSKGLTFYAGGVIRAYSPAVATWADPLRERMLDFAARQNKECGSAYVMAFDKLIELACSAEAAGAE